MAISRLDLLHAIVSQGTFNIDAYQTNTDDKTISYGHYYCDKAPGVVALAFPGFYLSSKILPAFGVPIDSEKGWLLSSWICVAVSVGLVTAIGITCLFRWLEGFASSRLALTSSLVAGFGSMPFPYSTMLMSHAIVVSLFCIALYYLRLGWDGLEGRMDNKGKVLTDLAAGAACGTAVACEYSAALVAAGILVSVTFISRKKSVLLVLGSIPPLSLILAYSWICLGSPFSLTYSHEAFYTENSSGFYGIHCPDSDNLIQLLFSAREGLFFWTPFLLLSLVGYPMLFVRRKNVFWLSFYGALGQMIVISGYWTVTAGQMLGPRLLAPILPLLILAASVGATKMPRTAIFLAWTSVAMTGTATLIDAHLPRGADPFIHFYVPQLLAGNFTYNLGEAIGLRGFWSIIPLLFVVSAGVWYLWRLCAPRERMEHSSMPDFHVNADEHS